MSTPLTDISSMMMTLVPEDYKTDVVDEQDIVKLGVIQFGIDTGMRLEFTENTEVNESNEEVTVTSVTPELTLNQRYLAALYGYMFYLMRLKDEFNRGAINFKTITFEVKSLEERAKQVEYTIRSLKSSISATVGSLESTGELGNSFIVAPIARMFGSDWNG